MANRSEMVGTDAKGRPPWLARTVIVAVGLGLWYFTQSLIGARGRMPSEEGNVPTISSGDYLFQITRPVNLYLHAHSSAADILLITSSAVIDAVGIGLIVWSILGPSIRPFVGMLLLFGLRQLSQALCVLPTPEGMIWRNPGFPTLLVTYAVANDFFFSGHTAIAVFGAIQLARSNRPALVGLGIMLAVFEAATVICLRAHYTMDVFTGALAAVLAALASERIAPFVDRALEKSGQSSKDL
jgi:hypothetical protein